MKPTSDQRSGLSWVQPRAWRIKLGFVALLFLGSLPGRAQTSEGGSVQKDQITPPAQPAGQEKPVVTPAQDSEAQMPAVETPDGPYVDNKVEMIDPLKPRFILEAIEVRGNSKSRGDLIISYLLQKPGESLDEEKVELSRIRLLALGYFKDVRMSLERGSSRGRVKLIVEVDERNTIIIDDIFLGFSTSNPFWGGLGISDINFLGRGLVLSGVGVASENQQALLLRVFWPSIFNTNLQGGFQAFFARGRELWLADPGHTDPDDPDNTIPDNNCNEFIKSDQELGYWRAGGTLTTGFRLDRVYYFAFDLHVEHIKNDYGEHFNGNGICKNEPFMGYLRKGQSTLSSLTFRFERDTRDDYFLPKSGMHLLLTIELASKILLFSDYEYSKYMIRYDQFFPAFADHAMRLTLMGGLIQDIGERGSPFFSRFFLGDYSLFWVNKSSLPRFVDLNFSDTTAYGDLMASIALEYDIPLWSNGSFFYRAYLYTAICASYVTKAQFLAAKKEWTGRDQDPNFTMDLGLKVDTPVGLLRISLGYFVDMIF